MDAVPHPLLSAERDLATDLAEVDAAIALVDRGVATRVRLVGLHRPTDIAGVAVAHAQAAGVGMHLERTGTSTVLVVDRTV